MGREKILFVWELFEAFQDLGIEKIPARIFSGRGDIKKVGNWLEQNFPEKYHQVNSLFIQKPTSGDYEIFRNTVSQLPHFHIRRSFDGFLYLNEKSPEKPSEMYIELAKKFCEVVDIKY